MFFFIRKLLITYFLTYHNILSFEGERYHFNFFVYFFLYRDKLKSQKFQFIYFQLAFGLTKVEYYEFIVVLIV